MTFFSKKQISEHPWQGVELGRDCLCSNISEKVVLRTLTSNVVELKFTVIRMNVTQDYRDFFFEGEFRFVAGAEAGDQTCATRLEDRRLRGSSGEISLRSPFPPIIPGKFVSLKLIFKNFI